MENLSAANAFEKDRLVSDGQMFAEKAGRVRIPRGSNAQIALVVDVSDHKAGLVHVGNQQELFSLSRQMADKTSHSITRAIAKAGKFVFKQCRHPALTACRAEFRRKCGKKRIEFCCHSAVPPFPKRSSM